MQISRRGIITGLISFAAAPAIVRIESLMPIKAVEEVHLVWDGTKYFDVYTDFNVDLDAIFRMFAVPKEYLR